jgi:predicted flap endonuclease-1-like 5' DNA nuclease
MRTARDVPRPLLCRNSMISRITDSGMIRGIGPVYAKKLVRAFGETVFDVIEQEPRRLREVTGIGPKRATRIIAQVTGIAPWRPRSV